MPIRTTARTAAFMPCESPPDVKTPMTWPRLSPGTTWTPSLLTDVKTSSQTDIVRPRDSWLPWMKLSLDGRAMSEANDRVSGAFKDRLVVENHSRREGLR